MKKILVLLLISLFVSCKNEKIPIAAESGAIKGEVLDAMTGPTYTATAPVTGANVFTYPFISEALSDVNGEFLLQGIPSGWYYLYAEKQGYNKIMMPVEVFSDKVSESKILLRPLNEENIPPDTAVCLYPKDGFNVYVTDFELQWECTDPDSNLVFFDVFLDETNPPFKKIYSSIMNQTAKVDSLEKGKDYYWRIYAQDWNHASVLGPVWKFTVK